MDNAFNDVFGEEEQAAPTGIESLNLSPQEQYLYKHHKSNLENGGYVQNDTGSYSSVRAIGVNIDGKEYKIPTVWNGKVLEPDAAIQEAAKVGWNNWPSYADINEADQRYEQLHQYMVQDEPVRNPPSPYETMKTGFDLIFGIPVQQTLPQEPDSTNKIFYDTMPTFGSVFGDIAPETYSQGAMGLVFQEFNMPAESAVKMLGESSFLSRAEGGTHTDGYVPNAGVSGVTVGMGVDLGQWNLKSLAAIGVPETTLIKLAPYFGLKREKAVDALRALPLTLTPAEAHDLSNRVYTKLLLKLEDDYNRASLIDFKQLPDEVKEAMISFNYQHGNISRKIPEYWNALLAADWQAARDILDSYSDPYKKRRKQEVALLDQVLEKWQD